MQNQNEIVKILLVGEAKTGKSEFLKKYENSSALFSEEYQATIGIDFKIKVVNDKKIKFQVWEAAGDERFKSITRAYYNSAAIVVLFVDASVDLNDLIKDAINKQLKEIKINAKKNASIVVVMSKSDSVDIETLSARKETLKHFIAAFQTENHLQITDSIQVISSKTNLGIDQLGYVFITEAEKIIKQRNSNKTTTVDLRPPEKESFMTRRPIVSAMLVGLTLGVVLAATGVFAPFGAAIAGAIALGAVGLAVFGVAVGLVNYLMSTSAPVEPSRRPTSGIPLENSPSKSRVALTDYPRSRSSFPVANSSNTHDSSDDPEYDALNPIYPK